MKPVKNVKNLFRTMLSHGHSIVKRNPHNKPDGISIILRVLNEANWIELALTSLKNFADEIIVVDHGSTDKTVEITEETKRKHDLNLKLYEKPNLNYMDLTNFALSSTSYKWVVKWDGDIVARTSGDNNIEVLRKKILDIKDNKYYAIFLSHVEIWGDLSHQSKDFKIHREPYIHTISPRIKYITNKYPDCLKIPRFYQLLDEENIYSFHINLKSAETILYRPFLNDWWCLDKHLRIGTFIEYANKIIINELGFNSISDAKKSAVGKLCMNLEPYDENKFGPFPELLKEKLENPPYKIVYKNGVIVGRNDVTDE